MHAVFSGVSFRCRQPEIRVWEAGIDRKIRLFSRSIMRLGSRSGHRASFRHIIPFPAAQGPAAEIPAGCRPCLIDGTAPLLYATAVGLFLTKVTARRTGQEIPPGFLQATLPEVMDLVGFALPDKSDRKPAAAFTAAAAGTAL